MRAIVKYMHQFLVKPVLKDTGGWIGRKALLAVLGVVVAVLAIYMFRTPKLPEPPKKDNLLALYNEPRGGNAAAQLPAAADIKPVVQTIVISPTSPSRQDEIKATVEMANVGDAKVVLEYQWKVNGKILENARDNILPKGNFRKADRVSVLVVPIINGERGDPAESILVVVRPLPPTLDLNPSSVKVIGDSAEVQLLGVDPDGDSLVYKLEAPVPAGASIDEKTGVVRLKFADKEKKDYQLNASVTNSLGVKVSRTFEFRAEYK